MRIIDTKIGTSQERPQLKIGDKLYKVDNRKKTYDEITKLQQSDIPNEEKEVKLFELTLGKKEAKEIFGLDLTVEEYSYLSFCVMGAITGEEPEKLMENSRKN